MKQKRAHPNNSFGTVCREVYGEMEISSDMYFLDLRLGFKFQIKTELPQWELVAGRGFGPFVLLKIRKLLIFQCSKSPTCPRKPSC